MHACGHDFHVAAGIGAATVLAESREAWSGTYIALFQPAAFIRWEQQQGNPFIDLSLFSNTTFTGATISNFLLNGTIRLLVSQQLIQLAGERADGTPYSALDAGLLTIGYGVFIIGFIRVGEKLLQRFGPRKPMIWGSLIVAASILLLMQTQLLIGQYVVLSVIAYCLFGLGLAFYATPSTDAALTNLPEDKTGSGSGIYKMRRRSAAPSVPRCRSPSSPACSPPARR